MKNLTILLGLLLAAVAPAAAQVAAGGAYSLEQAVVASGGGDGAGGSYALTGTIGQTIAGTTSGGSGYQVSGGFWTTQLVGPTAAPAKIEGRILTATGQGIRNVTVTLIEPSGAARTTLTGSFGYFGFADLSINDAYTLSVRAKRFQFSPDTQVVMLTGDITDMTFIALPAGDTRALPSP